MTNQADKLKDLKEVVEQALTKAGFSLEQFSIQVEDDENHSAHLRIKILPGLLKDEEETKIDEAFNDIIGGLE